MARERRRWRRLSLALAVTGFIILMLFITVYFDTGEPPTLAERDTPRDLVDFYLIQPEAVQFGPNGKPTRRFRAEDFIHHRRYGDADMRNPYFVLYAEQQRDWITTAEHGKAVGDGDQVQLWGDVFIRSTDDEFTLRTETLSLFPQEEVATTNDAVAITSPQGLTTAVGMKAELGIERVHLFEQVKGRYETQ